MLYKIVITIFYIQLIGTIINFLLLFFSCEKSDGKGEAHYEKPN